MTSTGPLQGAGPAGRDQSWEAAAGTLPPVPRHSEFSRSDLEPPGQPRPGWCALSEIHTQGLSQALSVADAETSARVVTVHAGSSLEKESQYLGS